ncbi:MAG: septum formation family protein [Propionibacteriaceae bacterium]|jgi:hypothetical protein|nr:septum formation family protein [Propionibacteriaceae bacterium]
MRRLPAIGVLICALFASACTAEVPNTPTPIPPPPTPTPTPWLSLAVGDCTPDIDFAANPMASAIKPVDCAEPHFYEVHSIVALDDGIYPGVSLLASAAAETCAAAFDEFVGVQAKYSRFSSAYLAPDAAGWSNPANRQLTCLVGSPKGGLVGTAKGDVTVFPKKGQCTGPQDVPALEMQIIDCAEKHNYEVYAVKTLKDKDAPDASERSALVDEVCKAKFRDFVGVEPSASKYGYTWFLTTAESWKKVKDHRLVCTVGSSKGGIKGTLKGAKK